MMDADDFHVRTNREAAAMPKSKSKHWCSNCDRAKAHVGEKCSACNARSGRRRNKKDLI